MSRDEQYVKAYIEHKTISRRGLFRALTNGATRNPAETDDSLASKLNAEKVVRVLPRPPQAIDEVLFQQICDGCGECQKACPEQVITIEGGLAQLTMDYGYCSQCGECGKSCPTGALHGSVLDNGLRPSFSESCQNALFGDCYLCEEACPQNAIELEDLSLPTVSESKCDGCGRCKQGCPFSSITLRL
ncbi:ferredoxin-type protein NapF [Vibrio sp. 10N]|uniref:ferredoxin-type protein NapF n=1 Tax=Vibrio sp. 10N TaxID=3058938 RepID=UPI0030C6823C